MSKRKQEVTPEQEYRQDVADMAESIQDYAKEQDYPDREDILEYLHESIDGCARVIYTASAKECVLFSRNDGAYFSEFGGDGASDGDGIKWSLLAYCAFRADVLDELDQRGFDVNAERPGYVEPDDADDAEDK